jgi:hypothetical protein
MFPGYAYHKTVRSDSLTRVNGRMGLPQIKLNGGLVLYTDGSKTNKDPGAVVRRWSLRREHIFSLGFNATLFQVPISNVKICIMENIEKSYKDGNLCGLS